MSQNRKSGFTLIEILVIVTILSFLSGILIVYNRSTERQILLFREQAKIINLILRAKSLALSTYTKSGSPCAYGIHFDQAQKEIRIFQDLDANGTTADCATADNLYDPNSMYAAQENLEPPAVEKLDAQVSFLDPLPVTDITFIAPNPDVVITPDPTPSNEAIIEIVTSGGISKKIKINRFGQVSVE
jgi:type II secretory pathway pseudopilin PulG